MTIIMMMMVNALSSSLPGIIKHLTYQFTSNLVEKKYLCICTCTCTWLKIKTFCVYILVHAAVLAIVPSWFSVALKEANPIFFFITKRHNDILTQTNQGHQGATSWPPSSQHDQHHQQQHHQQQQQNQSTISRRKVPLSSSGPALTSLQGTHWDAGSLFINSQIFKCFIWSQQLVTQLTVVCLADLFHHLPLHEFVKLFCFFFILLGCRSHGCAWSWRTL